MKAQKTSDAANGNIKGFEQAFRTWGSQYPAAGFGRNFRRWLKDRIHLSD